MRVRRTDANSLERCQFDSNRIRIRVYRGFACIVGSRIRHGHHPNHTSDVDDTCSGWFCGSGGEKERDGGMTDIHEAEDVYIEELLDALESMICCW
jgi:hypothetical protein